VNSFESDFWRWGDNNDDAGVHRTNFDGIYKEDDETWSNRGKIELVYIEIIDRSTDFGNDRKIIAVLTDKTIQDLNVDINFVDDKDKEN